MVVAKSDLEFVTGGSSIQNLFSNNEFNVRHVMLIFVKMNDNLARAFINHG